MIAASRRRRTERGDAFRLHEALAARASLSLRLRRGAVLALVASVLALVLGLGVAAHLLAVAAGLVAGAALPVRGAREEALAYIRGRAGLSYETALDVMSGREQDEFGLRAAVVDRARLAVRDVRPEPAPAWWLPALAVALGLVLFSLAGPLAGRGGTFTGGPAQPGGQPPAAATPAPEAGEELEAPSPPGAEPEPAGDGSAPDERGADEAGGGPGSAPPGSGGQSAAPLSRFLDSLRERPESAPPPQPEEPRGDDGAGAVPRAQGAAAPGQGGGEADQVELQRVPADRGDQGGDAGQPGEEGDGRPGDQEGEQQGGGDEPGREQAAGGGDEGGGEEGGGAPGPSGQPGAEDGTGPDPGGGQEEGPGGETTVGAAPEEGGMPPEGGDAVWAGAGPGAENQAGVAEGQSAQPELLPGVLQDGPENPAGTVRLPGDTDVFLPAGRAATDYQAAAEEALTEGDLPLSYQEVIRRYFR